MTEPIKYDRTSDTARAIWSASWAVEKLAKEITDISARDMTEQDMEDLRYFTALLCRRAVTLSDTVPGKSL